jgi:hypothetical protein
MLSHHEIAVLFERDRHSVENAMTIVARAYTHRRLYWIKFGVIRPLMIVYGVGLKLLVVGTADTS